MNQQTIRNTLRDTFFSPPMFPDNEEKNQRARVLHVAIQTFIVMAGVILIGSIAGGRTPLANRWINGSLIIFLVFAYYLMQKGWIQLAGIGAIAIVFIDITLGLAGLGTVRAPIAMGYITIVMVAGLLFGKRGLITTMALSSLTLLGLIYAENAEWLPPADFTITITQWITYTVLIGFTANIILTAREISDEFLDRAGREIEIRKKTEETLRIFSRAIEYSPTSVIITDINGNIVYVNPKFTQLTGYTKEESYGQTPRILKSGEHPPSFYTNLWGAILAGRVWQGTFHNRKKKNGGLYWEQASISPVLDNDDIITHFVAIKEDITDKRKAEQDLQKANKTLKRQITKIEALQASLREQVIRDPLTGLHNRRHMEEMLKKEHSRATREGHTLSLIMLDMDNLKTINDTGGHAIGDKAILRIANHLKFHTRTSDTVCRNGGDEFAVIMPNTSAQDALKRVEDWRKSISEITLLHIEDKVLHVTFTAGIAAYPDHGKTMEEVMNYADVALYRAKMNGRNRVELFKA